MMIHYIAGKLAVKTASKTILVIVAAVGINIVIGTIFRL